MRKVRDRDFFACVWIASPKNEKKESFRLDSVVRKLLTNPYFIIVVMVFAAYVFGLFR